METSNCSSETIYPDSKGALFALYNMASHLVAIVMMYYVVGGNSPVIKGTFYGTFMPVYAIGSLVFSVGKFLDIATPDNVFLIFVRYWKFYIGMIQSNFGLPDNAMYLVEKCALDLVLIVIALVIHGIRSECGEENVTQMKEAPRISYPKGLNWKNQLKKSFELICDFLIDEVIDDLKANYESLPEQEEWIRTMLEYNVKGGKMNRGLSVIEVQRSFVKREGRELSDTDYCRAAVLGWCVEWLQAFFLVADDVMDESITRRGQPCWYRIPKVKMIAINDSFILEQLLYKVLKRHISHESYYLRIVELFHDTTYRTELGQLLDLTSQPMDGPADISRFTVQRYKMIVKYKTAFYSFYLPCAIGMICARVNDRTQFTLARNICCSIGEYFQIQDDYLDCFGAPEVIGKIGTDIQDNKCSWLVVQALSRCSEAERTQLIANYGKDDLAKVAAVKDIYKQLNLPKIFKEYEDQSYETIQSLIKEVEGIPHEVFGLLLAKIYKRSK